ncbi:MAG: monomeric [FeFe] hydrogenase, partial [Clostridia bacterium]|nr:monomeric [FeFe] hydrogenase [Clostridia bacterium]
SHACIKNCPKGAVSIVNGKAFIDQEKCIKCGRCKKACPYDAIAHKVRPCAQACGVNAISSDEYGRAKIDNDICVACGQCMSACPFGAIADKSQIFQLVQALKKGDKIYACVAPAIAGQFGVKTTLAQIKTALIKLGFYDMYEVAEGADLGCIAEANHYVNEVATGKLPFLLTSCCPAWAVLAKKQFPDLVAEVSQELTPMVATARKIKEIYPEARVVFIGPCAAKKLEASRTSMRSFVDFVLTFEELAGMFVAKGINPSELEETPLRVTHTTGAGRGYAVAGGVAAAIERTVKEYYPETEVSIYHAEGLTDCKKILTLAKAGKIKGCLIEGMGCPGGCVAGVGTVIPPEKAKVLVEQFSTKSEKQVPEEEWLEYAERLTKMK